MMKTRQDNNVNYCIGVAYTEIEIEWSRQLKDVIDINESKSWGQSSVFYE